MITPELLEIIRTRPITVAPLTGRRMVALTPQERDVLVAALAGRFVDDTHHCAQCGIRWTGVAGAVYCGDCHRAALAGRPEAETDKLLDSRSRQVLGHTTTPTATRHRVVPNGGDSGHSQPAEAGRPDAEATATYQRMVEGRLVPCTLDELVTWADERTAIHSDTKSAIVQLLLAAIRQLRAPASPSGAWTWQPMETAPKDGRDILVAWKRGVFIAHWNENFGSWHTDNVHVVLADVWQPLPAPPPPTTAQEPRP